MTSAVFDDSAACEAAKKAMEASSGYFKTPAGYTTGIFGKCFPSAQAK